MEERETSERKRDVLDKKLHELFSQLSVTLGSDYGPASTAAFDKVMNRVRMNFFAYSYYCLKQRDNSIFDIKNRVK